MNLKSQKGYSLVEIGVGLIIIAVFMLSSAGLFRGCASTFRAIKQRNHVINHAISRLEGLLQTDVNTLLTEAGGIRYTDKDALVAAVESLKATPEGRRKLADGEYYVPADVVVGDFSDSPDTNNMRITTKIRRIPTTGDFAYDNTVLKLSVLVEYTVKAQRAGVTVPENEILKYEISILKVTNAGGV